MTLARCRHRLEFYLMDSEISLGIPVIHLQAASQQHVRFSQRGMQLEFTQQCQVDREIYLATLPKYEKLPASAALRNFTLSLPVVASIWTKLTVQLCHTTFPEDHLHIMSASLALFDLWTNRRLTIRKVVTLSFIPPKNLTLRDTGVYLSVP